MDRGYLERNTAELERLRVLVERLNDEDLAQPLPEGWTVAALLAHLAFWDRFVLTRWIQATQAGHRVPPSLDDTLLDLINAAALEEWRALPPRTAARLALTAAEAITRHIAGLPDEAVAEIQAARRLSQLDRTLHWRGHLDEIEAGLQKPSSRPTTDEVNRSPA